MASFSRRIDLHMHTTVSDGTDTPEQILEKVRQAGIEIFSVTDHDAVKAGGVIRGLLKEGDPRFIPGAEFSCRDDEGKYHILGYGYDPESAGINEVVDLGHRLRMRKVTGRLEFLKAEFGFVFTDEEIAGLLSMDNPGKPHIGNLMVKHGYAPSRREAIKDYLDKQHLKLGYIRPEQAIEGILSSGGIPVLAHPFYGSGDELIVGEDMENRLKKLMGFGLRGVEAFYSGFTEKLSRNMVELAERYDLYITAGSDYHGKNKLIELGDNGLGRVDRLPGGMERFLRDVNC